MPGLGRRQRELIQVMLRNDRRLPPRWRLTFPQRSVLQSLKERGLVTEDEEGWKLTEWH